MRRFNKYIALLLLSVFSLAVLPAPVVHEWFSDHTDAAENHCQFYHKDLGCHIEEQQNHCDLFKTSTPLYDALSVDIDFQIISCIEIEPGQGKVSALPFSLALRVPARAPPTA